MNNQEFYDIKEFLVKNIYPKFGKQPARLRFWDKRALRCLYMDYLKPNYHHIQDNPKLFRMINEVQRYLK